MLKEGEELEKVNLELIKQERIKQHITLDQCAKALGLSQRGPYLLKEQGKRKFTVNELPILSKTLNIPIDKLYK